MTELDVQLDRFFAAQDYSPRTVEAYRSDVARFVSWFTTANGERFDLHRITSRDVADFREHLRGVRRLSVSTTNRALVSLRRFLGYLATEGVIQSNPAKSVREIRRVATAPKGLSTPQVRKIMREAEIRGDVRGAALLSLMLHAGLRISEVAAMELDDLTIAPRSGSVIVRHGKGNKQRIVPLSLEVRHYLADYLERRPPAATRRVWIGQRGPLDAAGIRAVCRRYATITGVRFRPHDLRHTMAHAFLTQSNNDLVSLAQLLGHTSLNTTALYTKRTAESLQGQIEELRYG